MKLTSKRRGNTESEVIAATAGQDNWKTWAGRSHGRDGFEPWDVFRGAKRQFKRKFVWGTPASGTLCPVCYVEPESREEWHVTSSCGHAVCKDCLQGYAASLVRDPNHRGPLRCPVCPLPLRPKDAISALCGDPETIRLWDAKIRDELLRALPGYRHCPHCNETSSSDSDEDSSAADVHVALSSSTSATILNGGGFVTPECLGLINEEREQQALAWRNRSLLTQHFLVGAYALWLCFYLRNLSDSLFMNIIFTYAAPFWVLRKIWFLGRYLAANEARRVLVAPITVECPCCNSAFILNAQTEMKAVGITIAGSDKASQEWIESNTRPCPSCSVPIIKTEGCNHMSCTNCRADFCWACMRVGSCRAFGCRNGAPFGNATLFDVNNNDEGTLGVRDDDENGGILGRIDDRVFANASFESDCCVLLLFIGGYLARDSTLVQEATLLIVSGCMFFFSTVFLTNMILCLLVSRIVDTSIRVVTFIVADIRSQRNFRAGLTRQANEDGNDPVALEQRLLDETIQRSIVDR